MAVTLRQTFSITQSKQAARKLLETVKNRDCADPVLTLNGEGSNSSLGAHHSHCFYLAVSPLCCLGLSQLSLAFSFIDYFSPNTAEINSEEPFLCLACFQCIYCPAVLMATSVNQQGVGTAAHHHGEEQGVSTGSGDHSAQQHPHVSAHTSPLYFIAF